MANTGYDGVIMCKILIQYIYIYIFIYIYIWYIYIWNNGSSLMFSWDTCMYILDQSFND